MNNMNNIAKRCAARMVAILLAATVSVTVWLIMGHCWPETTTFVSAQQAIGWTTGLATIAAPLLGSFAALIAWFALDPGEYEY